MQTFAKPINDLQLLGHPQHVDNLMSARQQQHVSLTRGQRLDILLQRSGVLRQFPAVNSERFHDRPARLQAGNQRGVADTVLLQTNDLVGNRNLSVNRLQQFSPSIRLGNAVRRREPVLPHGGGRFWTATDRDHVGQRIEETLFVHVAFDRLDQIAKPDAGHQDHDADMPRHHPVGEINRSAIRLDRHLAHRRADVRVTTDPLDQAVHVSGATTLERGDSESFEVRVGLRHRCCECPGESERVAPHIVGNSQQVTMCGFALLKSTPVHRVSPARRDSIPHARSQSLEHPSP